MSRANAHLLGLLALLAGLWCWLAPAPAVAAGVTGSTRDILTSSGAGSPAAWSAPRHRSDAAAARPAAIEDQDTDPPEALGAAARTGTRHDAGQDVTRAGASRALPARPVSPRATGPPAA